MTVKEMKKMIDALVEYDENAEITFSVRFENPFDENSYQDSFILNPITTSEEDIFDWDFPHIFLEFEEDKTKAMMRKALDDYVDNYE